MLLIAFQSTVKCQKSELHIFKEKSEICLDKIAKKLRLRGPGCSRSPDTMEEPQFYVRKTSGSFGFDNDVEMDFHSDEGIIRTKNGCGEQQIVFFFLTN